MARQISICGTINYDRVVLNDGRRFESFGGILYNIIALAELSEGTELFPITWIGEERKEELWKIIKHYPQVSTKGIRVNPSGTNENLLVYRSADERDERLDARVPPVDFQHLEPFLHCDLFLVNFISGFDLSLETLTRLRDSFPGTIFMDIHSLTLGMGPQGRRFPTGLKGWELWVRCADIVQANRTEAELLTGLELEGENDYRTAGSTLLDLGPAVTLFTLGEKGCVVAFRKDANTLFSFIPAEAAEVEDSTGAGDIFSSAFIVKYMETADPISSAQFAASTAAKSCESIGLADLRALAATARHGSV